MERKGKNRNGVGGFTLIELMLVSAIISLLAAIAIPKFGDFILKAKEAAYKGEIGTVRSALFLYYANNEGLFPKGFHENGGWMPPNIISALEPKYIDKFPNKRSPKWDDALPLGGNTMISNIPTSEFSRYVWCYPETFLGVGNGSDAEGKLFPNCTHRDVSGRVWSTY